MPNISSSDNGNSIILEIMENKLETCHHCGEEKENCYHGFIAMCIPIPEAEVKKEKWNLIDAYSNYSKKHFKEWEPGMEYESKESFINKIKTDPEFLKQWYTKTWWKQLERTDLTEEESKELDNLATYDQLLNTVGRGVQCDDCGKKEAELYEIYYPKSLES
jgi:hypothetical protein